ncbi:MAG: NADPH:quinone reductase [Thermoleophilaceae bacterium]|nr:NADPH:quinone reductase [Thermoleophilaceae bacterium]
MRALRKITAHPGVELADAPDPEPGPGEALVDVKAFSLNRGEVRRLPSQPDGHVIGWDVAGVVAAPATDGSGPPAGARVVGLVMSGAWAERAAVPTAHLAELPEDVSFAAAATLPVAGLTALRALGLGGLLVGRRVLVTGAAGGVGRVALQLAARAGAHVTGVIGSPERGAGLRELGADELVASFDDDDAAPWDLILESAGGESLAAATRRVGPGGTVVAFGHSSGDETTFDVTAFYRNAPGARVYAFMVFDEVRGTGSSRDLRTLADLVASGDLDPQIALERSWSDAAEAIDALMGRRVAGKAVLHVD